MKLYHLCIINIIITKGILTGLKYKRLQIINANYETILTLPILPLSYNRREGLEFREMEEYYKLEDRL